MRVLGPLALGLGALLIAVLTGWSELKVAAWVNVLIAGFWVLHVWAYLLDPAMPSPKKRTTIYLAALPFALLLLYAAIFFHIVANYSPPGQ